MDRAREILGVEQELARLRRLRAARGRPAAAAARGLLRAGRRSRRPPRRWSRLIREFRPQVITTYDERGGYPHPDHIKTHEISVRAFEAAGDPDRYPELGEPGSRSKLYYHMSFTLPRTKALHEAHARGRRGVAVRASGWRTGTPSATTSPTGSPRGCRAPSTSRSATTR